jgi:transposase
MRILGISVKPCAPVDGPAIAHVAADLGVAAETLRVYVRRVEANEGRRADILTADEREEIGKLRRENFELRRANEILKSASVFFAKELDTDRPRRAAMSRSIAAVSGSSRSVGPWACRRPPTISAPQASARRVRLRMSGCSN